MKPMVNWTDYVKRLQCRVISPRRTRKYREETGKTVEGGSWW